MGGPEEAQFEAQHVDGHDPVGNRVVANFSIGISRRDLGPAQDMAVFGMRQQEGGDRCFGIIFQQVGMEPRGITPR